MASILAKSFTECGKQNIIKYRIRRSTIRLKTHNFSTEQAEKKLKPSSVEVKLGKNDCLVLSSGKLAKLADGCALVTFRDTTVMATVVSKEKAKEMSSFVPLTVSYFQKGAALGRIPVNFLRRELRQTDNEILTSRMIDRSIRPLFPEGFNWETQVICNPLALDGSNFPDVLGINAASAALAISGIPWNGPVGAVRIGFINGEPVVNPTKLEMYKSQLNLVVTARGNQVVTMLECQASNILQNHLFTCIKFGVMQCKNVIDGINALVESVGKEKRNFERLPIDPNIQSKVLEFSEERLTNIFRNYSHNKLSRDQAISDLQKEALEFVVKELPETKKEEIAQIFYTTIKDVLKNLIFSSGVRCDGRALDELREIHCEVDLYKPLHGSALFQRGQTQVLCTVALDSPDSALKMDKISMLTTGLKEKNFFVHYEFPPFATKDTGKMTGMVGRREIGHGALAEKALQANVPDKFPFTIRLTSEVLESNGSSSMATVCGGTLALLDAGVNLENPCAGVAMGLMSKCDEKQEITDYRILTDILGLEDFFGEMDFKIAGTKKAYTAFQLDLKNNGIPLKLVFEVLTKAKESISDILDIMRKACPQVRSQPKSNCPEIKTLKVPIHLRSNFIGSGGRNLKKLESEVGVEISEEEPGEFVIFAANRDAMKEADEVISDLLKSGEDVKLEFGGVYAAEITEIKESGCMVLLHPSIKPVYIHVSQLDSRKVSHPSALGLKLGQSINVKYFGRDPVSGAIRLSRKILIKPASEVVKNLTKKSYSVNGIETTGTDLTTEKEP